MTNHIIQVSFDMDTDRIQKIVQEQAARQIINDIKDKVEASMFDHGPYHSRETDPTYRQGYSDYIIEVFSKFLEDNREEIVEITSNKLVEKVFRSKSFKDTLDALSKK